MEPTTQNQVNEAVQRLVAPLQQQLATLQQKVTALTPRNTSKQQLTIPLDPTTQGILRKQTVFQVSFPAPGTSAATAANYGLFFQTERPVGILSITEVHTIAGTDAGAVTLNVEKLTGTQAPGSGAVMLTTAFNLKAAINTPQYGALNPTIAFLNKGDRISALLTGTPTSVTNVVVSVILTLL